MLTETKIYQPYNQGLSLSRTQVGLTLLCHSGNKKINVGWVVACFHEVVRNQTQQYRGFWLLGYSTRSPFGSTFLKRH